MKNKKVAIVHYTYPPVIGGVEIVVQAHARILARNGYRVRVISGEGKAEDEIELKVIPELKTLTSFDGNLNKSLKEGKLPHRFSKLKKEIFSRILKEMEKIDVCIIHNVMTMHFNLPLTCALKEVIKELSRKVKFYLWCHDSAIINPTYQKDIPQADEYPWNVLSEFIPQAEYITISKLRQRQLANLFSVSPETLQVVPGGIDLKSFLNISDSVWNFAWEKDIFTADVVMFFPSRILKRKNYQLGIRVTAQMKKRGKKVKFIITAPPDPHNPETVRYFDYLHRLCEELGVGEEVIFLCELKKRYNLKLNFKQIKELYSICDVLFVTSTQEGFGLPLLEAGAERIPIICTSIESLSEVVKNYALRVNLEEDIPQITSKILDYLDGIPTSCMFKRVARCYSWEAIYKNYLKKLVDKDAKNRCC